MPDSLCLLIDDYLEDELSDADRRAFDHHLGNCEQCQTAVLIQQRLDDALSGYAETITPASSVLRPRKMHWGPTAIPVAACVALAAILLIAWISSQAFDTTDAHSEIAASPKLEPSQEGSIKDFDANRPRLRSIVSEEYLAIVEPSADDDMTVIMLYPKISQPDEL